MLYTLIRDVTTTGNSLNAGEIFQLDSINTKTYLGFTRPNSKTVILGISKEDLNYYFVPFYENKEIAALMTMGYRNG